MSIDVSFHNHGLVNVRKINEELTTLDIYDNPDYALGTRVILFFESPTEVANFASKIVRLAIAAKVERKVEV